MISQYPSVTTTKLYKALPIAIAINMFLSYVEAQFMVQVLINNLLNSLEITFKYRKCAVDFMGKLDQIPE